MRNIANYVIAIISLTLGFLFGQWILSSTDLAVLFPKIVAQRGFIRLIIYGSISLLSALIFYILLSLLWKYGSKHVKSLADTIGDKPPLQIIGGSVGLLVGLIVAFFVSNIFSNVYSALNVLLSVITYTFFGTLGLIVGSRMAYSPEFPHFNIKSKIHEKNNLLATAKVLDTSAIIDGRIVEIAKTGFISISLSLIFKSCLSRFHSVKPMQSKQRRATFSYLLASRCGIILSTDNGRFDVEA